MARGDEEKLLRWFWPLSPLRVDIVGDFAGKELFAIHGDSLMLHCISEAKVDFSNGFQLLHAVHAVESFLSNLRQRGCNFHVVWFRDHEQLCVSKAASTGGSSSYQRLTRAILIKHLQQYAGSLLFEFQDVDCGEFHQYLAQHALHFFLCLDGYAFDGSRTANGLQFVNFMHKLASNGYSIALINDLEFASSKVLASVFSPSSGLGEMQVPKCQPRPRISIQTVPELELNLNAAHGDWTPWEDGEPLSARDTISLTSLCNVLLMDSGSGMRACAAAHVVHLCAIRRCSLSRRSCATTPLDEMEQACFDSFLACFAEVCISVVEKLSADRPWDAFDLLDGRILRQVFKKMKSVAPPPGIAGEARRFAERIHSLTKIDIAEFILPGPINKVTGPKQALMDSENSSTPAVLPFSQPALDKYLESIHVVANESEESTGTSKIFQELSHWHNARVPIDPRHTPRPSGFFARKRNQKWMAETIAYSASLNNASGKIIKPEIIVPLPAPDAENDESERKAREKGEKQAANTLKIKNKNKKQNPKSGRQSALEEAQRIQRGKLDDKAGAAVAFWDERCREFEAERNLAKRYLKAAKYFAGLSSQDMATVGAEVSLYLCNVLASMILDGRKRGGNGSEMAIFAMIWSRVRETADLPLSPESLAELEMFAKALLIRLSATVLTKSPLKRRTLPFPSTVAASGAELRLPTDALEFQLKHCGPYLERSVDAAADPRVPSFLPDAWQRRVLDAIDAGKSLFVVAPTSAGKTFISFYAMKKVLKSSDDSVLVYVAPTKALVNQIAAEIQGRFSKSYGHDGRSVWAIHTRDYRVNNPKGCQVLVTVPHILQIMLLAPYNAEREGSWSLRVKRIIFDEVHCIGQAEDGVVWEQLILLAPCPIIALSATVGNPLEFRAWLEASERAKGHELDMIVHSSRYSDLRKFIYGAPGKLFIFRGLMPVDGLPIPGLDEGRSRTSPFVHIHPIASLVNRNCGTIDDISLEPRDCLTLWRCMLKHQTEDYPLDDALSPLRFFSDVVKKPDVVRWESALKGVLGAWMQDPRSPFALVRSELDSTSIGTNSSCSDEGASSADAVDSDDFGVDFKVGKDLRSTVLPLLTNLHGQGALPAILFNYDRARCEKSLLTVVDQLLHAEGQWKSSSPQWAKKLAEYERWKQTRSQGSRPKRDRAPRGRAQDESGPGLSKLDMVREEASRETSVWASFDPEAPLDMFSFADRTRLLDFELEGLIRSLREAKLNPKILSALRRGMAVHHAGMNRGYRQVVEMLFRKGFLTVVIATGTLALGLNMPCKTVVFLGDSIFLTALNYLQAAGRAGRRGFDVLGNVVFTGMPGERVLEIMSSRLPDLRGHFTVSTTLVVRLLGLLHHTGNSAYAVRAMGSLLSMTRLYLGGPADQMAIKHHLRFSIEYLRRQQLVSRDGAPLNFAGLVGHLYFTENAVFAFHSLLKGGYFHEVCAGIHRRPREVLLELVLVLAHLFCRIPVRSSSEAWMANVVHRSPSVVLLPPLPERAGEILVEHNRETLGIFRTYVGTFVDQHLAGTPDNRLPLTGLEVWPQQQQGLPSMVDHVAPTRLRSPFAALSGFSDDFESIHELCTTVRSGVYLEESAVPYIAIYPADTAGVPWNAYVYDFFKHGDLVALVRDNGIKSGDVWFRLKDFSLILATVVTSLANFFCLDSADGGDEAMADVQDVDEAMQEGGDGTDEPEPGPEPATGHGGAVGVAAQTSNKASKKTVADSWEDDTSDGEGAGTADGPADGAAARDRPAAWQDDGEESLVRVLAAFRLLQQEFDDRFRKVWA